MAINYPNSSQMEKNSIHDLNQLNHPTTLGHKQQLEARFKNVIVIRHTFIWGWGNKKTFVLSQSQQLTSNLRSFLIDLKDVKDEATSTKVE